MKRWDSGVVRGAISGDAVGGETAVSRCLFGSDAGCKEPVGLSDPESALNALAGGVIGIISAVADHCEGRAEPEMGSKDPGEANRERGILTEKNQCRSVAFAGMGESFWGGFIEQAPSAQASPEFLLKARRPGRGSRDQVKNSFHGA